jgi:mitotic spindle assembly checkpoint protein MAD2
VCIVTEFFHYAINSILYQRGIYEPETFKRESKYGLTVLTSTDAGLLEYLGSVMEQMGTWLTEGDVQRLVLVVAGVDSGETLERWTFNVSVDDTANDTVTAVDGSGDENSTNSANNNAQATTKKKSKTIAEINSEIAAIIRQITASVTFLPLLTEPCTFDLLIYTSQAAAVPTKWIDSDPQYIMNSSEVKLRSFTTSVHKVDSMVAYREKDEWDL